MISFDPTLHQYSEDGVVLPSVTEILKRVGLLDTKGFSRESANFGTEVHETTTLIDLGRKTVEEYEDDPRYRHLKAWELFKEIHHPVILEVEQIVGGVEV